MRVDLDSAKPGEQIQGVRIGPGGEPALESGATLARQHYRHAMEKRLEETYWRWWWGGHLDLRGEF